jgi:hypothetical protein
MAITSAQVCVLDLQQLGMHAPIRPCPAAIRLQRLGVDWGDGHGIEARGASTEYEGTE